MRPPKITLQKHCDCGEPATIKRAGEWMCCRDMEHHQQHISAIWKSNGEDTKRKMRATETEIQQPEPTKPGRAGILIESRFRIYAL